METFLRWLTLSFSLLWLPMFPGEKRDCRSWKCHHRLLCPQRIIAAVNHCSLFVLSIPVPVQHGGLILRERLVANQGPLMYLTNGTLEQYPVAYLSTLKPSSCSFHCSSCSPVSFNPLVSLVPLFPLFHCSSYSPFNRVPLITLFPLFPCSPCCPVALVTLLPLLPFTLVFTVPLVPLFLLFHLFLRSLVLVLPVPLLMSLSAPVPPVPQCSRFPLSSS